MHILMYRWKAYNYRDIEQTFRLLGHTVDNIEQELGNYDIDPEFEAQIEALMEKIHYDMVFTVNYFALISNTCQKMGVKYVSWTCDNPLISMYHVSVFNDCNYIFTFDKTNYLEFKEMGVKETTAIKLGALEHKEVHLSDIRKRNKLLEDKVSQLEYELLKGKLPKQFMLNLLTTVSSFSILENASRTENITAEMASVLRYYLDNSSEVISLSEELKQIECYLDILRQQYDNRLEYRVYCQKEVEKQKIPIIGIFPFVEQLVDFGILAGHFRGTLYIDAEKKEDFCKVVLQLESSGLSVGHFGADITDGNFAQMQEQDTRKRYEREFGKDFEITADPNVITIQIPFQEIK